MSKALFNLSGYRDSNPGPPTPEAGALTGLRYTPNEFRVRTWPRATSVQTRCKDNKIYVKNATVREKIYSTIRRNRSAAGASRIA